VEEQLGLLMDGGGDRRMAMAEDGDGEPAGEVQVLIAIGVPEAVALAPDPGALEVAGEHRRQVPRTLREGGIAAVQEGIRGSVRSRGVGSEDGLAHGSDPVRAAVRGTQDTRPPRARTSPRRASNGGSG
jgi:hypothetical protein